MSPAIEWPSSSYWWPALVPRRSISTPWPDLTKEQSRRSSKRSKRAVIETLSARASASSVDSEGEIAPFSILESMPGDSPAISARSTAARSSLVRSARTCEPIAASSDTPSDVGAEDPVVSVVSFRRRGRDACFDGRGIEEPRERDVG